MKLLNYEFETVLEFSAPVSEHQFTLRCLPVSDEAQTVLAASPRVQPQFAAGLQQDGFGSTVLCGSLMAPHDRFAYGSSGLVRVDLSSDRAARGYNPALHYPGALTVPDETLRQFGRSLNLQGYSPMCRCEMLNSAVHQHFSYQPGTTNAKTTAAEAFAAGRGVCQDYAHVFVALARLCGFAARYCMGLTVGEGATHAWAEVFLPQRGWTGFDPTRHCKVDESYLRFGTGRDAADCPVERGVFRGIAAQTQTVRMQVKELEQQTTGNFLGNQV